MSKLASNQDKKWAYYTLALIIGLLILRLVTLRFSQLGLHGDEAQYWSWAQDLDWGYFSKPPLIAWLIALTTGLFGDAEWAARLGSPILHILTSIVLYKTAVFLYDRKTGFIAALIYLIMPGVSLSSGIVSTDVPLLFFWSVSLYSTLRFRAAPSQWGWAILMGTAFGLGLLAKYAMLFFIPALVVALLIDKPTRRAFLSLKGLCAAVIAGLILSPNILWNAQHDFATVSHTAANTNLQQNLFHPSELIEFWTSQLGVFGPLTFVLLILALIFTFKNKLGPHTKWLALFVLSPLIIISIQALLSRANANWAVSAYIAGVLLAARYMASLKGKGALLSVAILINAAFGAIMMVIAVNPKIAESIGQANAIKRLQGWPQTRDEIAQIAKQGHEGKNYKAIVLNNRIFFYDMVYYDLEKAIGTGAPLKIWLNGPTPHNHAEATQPYNPRPDNALSELILMVLPYDTFPASYQPKFSRVEKVAEIDIPLSGNKQRQYKLWAAYNYRQKPDPTRHVED